MSEENGECVISCHTGVTFCGGMRLSIHKQRRRKANEKIEESICLGIEHADERAWAAFYAAFAPVMRAYAVRRGCDEPDDAVQDACLSSLSRLSAMVVSACGARRRPVRT